MPVSDLLQVRSPHWVALETEAATKSTVDELRGLRRDLVRRDSDRTATSAGRVVIDHAPSERAMGVLSESMAAISANLQTVENSIEYGFRSLMGLVRNQTERIAHALENPEQTRAGEQRRLGFHAFARISYGGRWRDDAVEYFAAATTIDRKDFEAHWMLGTLYGFYLFDDDRARDSFGRCADYAWPDDPEMSAAALLAVGLIDAANGRPSDALTSALKATQRAPHQPVAMFDVARYAARTGDCGLAANHIDRAVLADPTYYDRAVATPELHQTCGEQIDGRLRDIRSEALSAVTSRLQMLLASGQAFTTALAAVGTGDAFRRLMGEVAELAERVRAGDYVVLRDALERTGELRRQLVEAVHVRYRTLQETAAAVAKPKGHWTDEPSKSYLLYFVIFGIPTWLSGLAFTYLLHWPTWIPWAVFLLFTVWAHEIATDSGYRQAIHAKRAHDRARRTLQSLEDAKPGLDLAERTLW
jgi:tetratricopeptide (TPR) repeat protein